MRTPPRRIGLTGGIASGKSTVARVLDAAGASVIDADVLAREAVAPGSPGLALVARRFPGVVAADGALDRKALGAQVFADEDARRDLEAIIHPEVERGFGRALAQLDGGVAVLVIPLLYEAGLERLADEIWVVSVPPDVQLSRLQARDGLSAEEARARMAAQWPLSRKVALADRVIDNGGPVEALEDKLRPLLADLGLTWPGPARG